MSPAAAIRIRHSSWRSAGRPSVAMVELILSRIPVPPHRVAHSHMATDEEQPFSDLEDALKKSAAALRGADVPFLLGGSLASWARGGPETRHDLDLVIKPADVDRALEALEQAGLKREDPPEEWLVKAGVGNTPRHLLQHPP